MKNLISLSMVLALVMAFAVSDVMAKGGKGQTLRLRDGSCKTTSSMTQDQLRDRDRTRDRDQIMKQNMLQDRDQLRDKDQLRVRDRIHR